MDWTPILTVVATGAVTLSGVWINGRITARSDQRKLEAEQKKLDTEAAREADRQRREDQAEAKREARERDEADAARGQEIVDALLKGLRDVRDFEETDEDGFRSYFESKWSSRLSLIVRPIVGQIRDDESRSRLVVVMDGLDDFSDLAEQAYGANPRRFAESTILLMTDLASAVARRQRPEPSLLHDYDKLVELIDALDQHRRFQHQMRAEERAERMQAERKARLAAEKRSLNRNPD